MWHSYKLRGNILCNTYKNRGEKWVQINKTNKRSTLKIKSVNTEKSERVMIYKIGCSFYVLKELILKFKERKRG